MIENILVLIYWYFNFFKIYLVNIYLIEITACFIICLLYNGGIIIIFIVLGEYAPHSCYIEIIQFLSPCYDINKE